MFHYFPSPDATHSVVTVIYVWGGISQSELSQGDSPPIRRQPLEQGPSLRGRVRSCRGVWSCRHPWPTLDRVSAVICSFYKAIRMKPKPGVSFWTRITSLFVAPCDIVTWLVMVTWGCEVTLARQTRGGVTLTRAGSTQEPRNPRNWHPSGSRVSLYLRVYSCSLSSIPSIPEFLCVYAFNVRAPKHLRTPNTNFTFCFWLEQTMDYFLSIVVCKYFIRRATF